MSPGCSEAESGVGRTPLPHPQLQPAMTNPPPPDNQGSEANLRQALERAGRRFTRQRAEVFAYLRSVDSHPTAEQVFDAVRLHIPNLSLATVYKALEALVDAGLAARLPDTLGGPAATTADPSRTTIALRPHGAGSRPGTSLRPGSARSPRSRPRRRITPAGIRDPRASSGDHRAIS